MNTTTLTHMAESVRGRAADVAHSMSERAPELRRDVGHRVADVGAATHRIAAALPFVEPPRRRSLVARFWYVPMTTIVVAAVGVLVWWFATHRGPEGGVAGEEPGESTERDERLYAVGH